MLHIDENQSQDMVSGASPTRDKSPAGYLAASEIPDGVALLPKPPVPGSKAAELDTALNQQALETGQSACPDLSDIRKLQWSAENAPAC